MSHTPNRVAKAPEMEGNLTSGWDAIAAPASSELAQRRESHTIDEASVSAARYGFYGARLILVGGLLSGPIGLLLVAVVHPTGSWQGSKVLAEHYHPIQVLPFFLGLVLVMGCDLVIASAYCLASDKDKTRALLAVVCTAAFTGLISFNYICQTTFLPALLTHYRPEYDAIVSTLSLVNPRSLSWAIEMWGWGLLGLATWLVAPVFHGSRIEKATAWTLVLNGIMSVIGALVTAVDLSWVLTMFGMINFAAWNVLMLILAVLLMISLSTRVSRYGGDGHTGQSLLFKRYPRVESSRRGNR